ncbi:2-nitropropane dioxygenase [Xylariaceae sp. FL0255]|nr:2-nitropropane dioxygenase [Xylariaceae sp. FL0255]
MAVANTLMMGKKKHPVLLAGMGMTSTAALAAAVSNAGGLGVIGGVGYNVSQLRDMIRDLKSQLREPSLPFGVDLLIPQVGDGARKTNYDYTKGALDDLVDMVIAEGAKLFVSAVGVPPRRVVDKLHEAGVLYMNMVGHPKHVAKACAVGADIICAQGGEAGGHGIKYHIGFILQRKGFEINTACFHKFKSPLTGKPVALVAAGGINDGRSLAAALMLGAEAVWIGTRFVAARESGASDYAKRVIVEAGFEDVVKSVVWTGRPLRAHKSPYIADWEENRQAEIRELTSQGILPVEHELDRLHAEGKLTDEIMEQAELRPMGVVAALINKADQPAKDIVDEIVTEAAELLAGASKYVSSKSRL